MGKKRAPERGRVGSQNGKKWDPRYPLTGLTAQFGKNWLSKNTAPRGAKGRKDVEEEYMIAFSYSGLIYLRLQMFL